MRAGRVIAPALAVAAFAALAGCSTSHLEGLNSDFAAYPRYVVKEAKSGTASYYANRFHGRRTACGETYDRNMLTAAHRSYPFGTIVRVVEDKSRRSVIVRINDRGPRRKGRIIDLSYAAAEELDMIRAGIVKVKVEVLQWGGANREALE